MKKETTGTLGKLMAVVDVIAYADQPMRFTDILNASDQPRGTLHRHLSHLVEEGLLDLGQDGTYQLGLRMLKLASKAWTRNDFRTTAAPFLQSLHEATGETIHFGFLSGLEIIYIDKVDGRQSVRMHSNIGKVSPLHCTGVGKAVLSVLEAAELDTVLASTQLQKFTNSTITDVQALHAELALIRDRGYAFDREEHEPGIRCVAAPVKSPQEKWVAAISVSGPAFRISEAMLEEWSKSVCDTADKITEAIFLRIGPKARLRHF